jgi:transcription elongation factor Elf1
VEKKIISKSEAYKAMNKLENDVMNQELNLVFNSDQRGKQIMTHQFYLDNEGFLFLEMCWDGRVVQTLSIGHKPSLKNDSPATSIKQMFEFECFSCEETSYSAAPVDADARKICITCLKEEEQHQSEMAFMKNRMVELSGWLDQQGNLSLEEIMNKAYSDFIHFEDYGRILHLYMKRSPIIHLRKEGVKNFK